MLEKLKNLFYKKSLNLDLEDDMSIFDYHSTLKTALVLNGLFLEDRESGKRLIVPLTFTGFTIIAVAMMWINIYHALSENNVPEFSESLAYVLIVQIVLLQLIWLTLHHSNYYNIVDTMDQDYENLKKAQQEYKDVFYGHHLLIWQLVFMWSIVAFLIGFSYMFKNVLDLLYQRFIEEYYEGRQRPFMFSIWLPFDDVHRTPVYETFLIIQYVMVFVSVTVHGTFVAFNIIFLAHPVGQLKLVDLSLEKLFQDNPSDFELRQRLGNIVTMHLRIYQICDDVGTAFGLIWMYQILLTPIELCVTAFQIADGLDKGEIRFLFLLIFIGTLAQLSIPCILGSKLTEKASETSDMCYFCGWEKRNVSKNLRNDLQIFIMKANRELTVNALGMVPVSMETYSSVLKTAGSYFTMLRQFNENTA